MMSTEWRLERWLVVVLCGLLGACSTAEGDRLPGEITGYGLSVLPSETLQDWVTYGDELALVTVLAEQRIPAPQEEVDRGEGHIMRTVSLAVGKPLWTRPTLKGPAIAFPTQMTVLNGGWVFHGQEEARLVLEDDPWMTVGGVHLAVLSFGSVSNGEPGWFLLAQSKLSAGVVQAPANEHRRAVRTLAEKAPAEVASFLRATQPDPRVVKHMAEDPVLRWRRVSTGTMRPGPGER